MFDLLSCEFAACSTPQGYEDSHCKAPYPRTQKHNNRVGFEPLGAEPEIFAEGSAQDLIFLQTFLNDFHSQFNRFRCK